MKVNAVIVSGCPPDCGLSTSAALRTVVMDFFQGLHSTHALAGRDSDENLGQTSPYDSSIARHSSLILVSAQSAVSLPLVTQLKMDRPVILVTNSSTAGREFDPASTACVEAWALLRVNNPTLLLREVSLDMLDQARGDLSEGAYHSAKHHIHEQRRVHAAAIALKGGDFKKAGKLLTESHNSLKETGISCKEVDILVRIASRIDGVYGSRIVVDGCTRCSVTLVKRSAVGALKKALEEDYLMLTRRNVTFYECAPALVKSGLIDITAAILAADSDKTFVSPLPTWVEYMGYLVPLSLAASAAAGALLLIRMQ